MYYDFIYVISKYYIYMYYIYIYIHIHFSITCSQRGPTFHGGFGSSFLDLRLGMQPRLFHRVCSPLKPLATNMDICIYIYSLYTCYIYVYTYVYAYMYVYIYIHKKLVLARASAGAVLKPRQQDYSW